MPRGRSLRLASALALAVGILAVPASADSTSCGDPGSKVPVLFVHGWTGRGADWKSTPVFQKVSALDGVWVSDPFDYQDANTQWVTDPRIGQRLAGLISCLADRSASEGGPGKVVLVAHSMGGLAVRWAAGPGGVSDQVGLVVTIGTPNDGSWLASLLLGRDILTPVEQSAFSLFEGWCGGSSQSVTKADNLVCTYLAKGGTASAATAMVPGSDELNQLPPIPEGIPVLALAGRIQVTTNILGKQIVLGDIGDGLVDETSATNEATASEAGGGTDVNTCTWQLGKDQFSSIGSQEAPCFHPDLIKQDWVAAKTVQGIEDWMAQLPSGPGGGVTGPSGPTGVAPTTDPETQIQDFSQAWSGTSARIAYAVTFNGIWGLQHGSLVLSWRPPDAFRMDYKLQILGGVVTLIALRGKAVYLCQAGGGSGYCTAFPASYVAATAQVPFVDLFSGPDALLHEIEAEAGGAPIHALPSKTIAGFSATCFGAKVPSAGGKGEAEWCFSGNGVPLLISASEKSANLSATMEATAVTGVSDAAFNPPFPVS